MSDDTPDAREREEAEALARALEGEPSPGAPPDALEAAALLRHARGHDVASARRLELLREQALRGRPRALTPARVGVGMAALAAAAAVAVAVVPQLRAPGAPAEAPAAQVAQVARPPSATLRALVDAQVAAVNDPEAPLDALAAATAARRRELFAGLEERLGGPP